MLKIYSSREFLPENLRHVVMLFPFWKKTHEDRRAPESGRYDRYIEMDPRCFEMTSLSKADVAVLPMPWEHVVREEAARASAMQFLEKVKSAGKPVVIFFWSDLVKSIPIENAIIFRTSFYLSTRALNEFAMPAWSEDFVSRYLDGETRIREKRAAPVIGFCGYAAPWRLVLRWALKDRICRLRHALGKGAAGSTKDVPYRGPALRTRAMRVLTRSSQLVTNFVVRKRFLAGALLPDGGIDLQQMQRARREYVTNMLESDYIVCVRGGGNFSYRLYETLCMGRIPIFINTDCVLPYDWLIDWKKYCVWIEEREVHRIAEKVYEFHEALSNQDFTNLQKECRTLWERYLSPEGFFRHFYLHFEKQEKDVL